MREIHEAANAFPMMQSKEFDELARDISANGLQVPIAIYQGKILDGRNRFAACEASGVSPIFQEVETDDPYMWV